MNKLASVIDKVSKSPRSTRVPASSGSSMPLTELRLMVSVALPKTTSEMLSPMDPPMRKVGSRGLNATAAPERAPWVQSSTAPVATEVLFSWSTRLVPIIWTTSTPCNCALPKAPSSPVYLRTEGNVV